MDHFHTGIKNRIDLRFERQKILVRRQDRIATIFGKFCNPVNIGGTTMANSQHR